jgi:hypothetical protein
VGSLHTQQSQVFRFGGALISSLLTIFRRSRSPSNPAMSNTRRFVALLRNQNIIRIPTQAQ